MTQKKQIVVLAALLMTAAIVWYFERQKPAAASSAVFVAQNYQLLSVENPQLHKDKLDAARKTEYKSTGRNIFSAIAPPPVSKGPEKVIVASRPVGPQPEPPPPPPSLPANMKFFGYGTVPNGTARRAFFTDGEDVYIVAEGDLLLNRFRILKVGNASLEFEEISSGRHGSAILEDQGSNPAA
jgi:hypothetical protein